jgi:hypothetical protein
VGAVDLAKCQDCDPVTVVQIKDLFDARFNEFRLELYKSGVYKPPPARLRNQIIKRSYHGKILR